VTTAPQPHATAPSDGLLAALRAHAARPGEALVTDARRLSRKDLAGLVAASAEALARQGVGPGTMTGLTLRDETEHLLASLALAAPPGEPGEIRLRAPGMARAYHDDPEETALRFRGGWFHPGDLASRRADGQMIIHGRADDMMILNGINIYPAEIEAALERHPAVANAAALPVRSTAHGEIPVAAVELLPGAAASRAELLAFARARLGLRAPRRVLVLERLPRSPQGKVLKREIAPRFAPAAGAESA
jgi:acyl-CoA synthetase (AMP-forming)/AMP-acid ligase II